MSNDKPAKPGAKASDVLPTSPPAMPASNASDERSLYWIGCDLEGPQMRYQIAGTTFQHAVDKSVKGEVTSTSVAQLGNVEYLTADQVARIKRNAHREVVRTFRSENGEVGRQLLACTTRRYIRERGDYPVGCHVYMVPVDEKFIAPRIDASLPDRLMKPSDWVMPTREEDPIITAEKERAKIQAEAIAQAVSALHAAAK